MDQAIKIKMTVNGEARQINLGGWERLSDILREHLDLTGTKRGCDDASCGACVVIVNGEAQKSCLQSYKKVDQAQVQTIEGMAKGTDIHPIQAALIEAGAVQCGFCIPGIVMRLEALFTQDVNASREAVLEALNQHLCRCTGYEAIVEGAMLAQQRLQANS